MAAREKLHDLGDRPQHRRPGVAARGLESVAGPRSPGRTPLAALPLDRQELSDEALRAVEEGIADHLAGRTYGSDEVKRELGISVNARSV